MPRVGRHDVSSLQGTRRTPQGGIVVSARCARTGIQEYQQDDGSVRREYRPPDEVFDPASIESFKFAPLTIGHPPQVTAENWQGLAVGHVGPDPRPDDGRFIASDLYVQDAKAARDVESKRLSELSCGYSCELDATPGVTPDGEQYDAVQRNIRHNHLALLPPGHARGGPELRIRLDSKGDSYLAATMPGETSTSSTATATRTDDKAKTPGAVGGEGGLTTNVHIHDHRHDERHEHVHDEAKKKADALEGENAALKAENARLKTDNADAKDAKKLDARVAARFELVAEARKHLQGAKRADGKGHDPWDPAGKSDLEIKRAVLEKLSPSVKLDGKSEEFVAAAYEVAVGAAAAAGAGARSDASARSTQASVPVPRTDGDHQVNTESDRVKDARDAMIKRMKDRGRRDKSRGGYDGRSKDGRFNGEDGRR